MQSAMGGGVFQSLPSSWDWRTQGKITPVRNQGSCGSCYAFASIANVEARLLVAGEPAYDFSENNAKECNWDELNDIYGGTSCSGGNYDLLVNLFSQKGIVLESCDPYVASDVGCNATCSYQKTLLDWRIIGRGRPTRVYTQAYFRLRVHCLHQFSAAHRFHHRLGVGSTTGVRVYQSPAILSFPPCRPMRMCYNLPLVAS